MITPKRFKYRTFDVLLQSQNLTTTVHWSNAAIDCIGYQQVPSHQWSDGELLRFAMNAIDDIWQQINRVEEQTITGRGQP